MLDAIDGVDFVDVVAGRLPIEGPTDRGIWDVPASLPGIRVFAGLRLNPDELVNFVLDGSRIEARRQATLPRLE